MILEPERHQDARGYFARTRCAWELTENGLDPALSQCSVSFNHRRGTLRGLHYQLPPHTEVKLVRCLRGALFDVAVDLRPDSPTFGRHVSVELNVENGRALYIPRGCAHGFYTLVDTTEVEYFIGTPHHPDAARGVRYDDPLFEVPWPWSRRTAVTPRWPMTTEVRPDWVFHLGGLASGGRELLMLHATLEANFVPVLNLLLAAQQQKVRLIFAGSLEEPAPDGSWPVPGSPYAASKMAAALYARLFHALYQTQVVWLRLFMVYGPQQPDFRKLVPYVTLSLLRGEAPRLSSGTRPVDWVFIDDVVDAFLAAAVTPGAEGRSLDVGSGELVTVRGMVESLVQQIDPSISPSFGALPDRALEQVSVADVAATTAALGWRPRVALPEGLARTVAWYREQGWREPRKDDP